MFATFKQLDGNEARIRRARYGVIEFRDGELVSLQLRPFPKLGSLFDVWWCERFGSRRIAGDCCRLFYNEPRNCPGYLTLAWMQSTRETRLPSVFGALDLLDEIAELKQSDAIVCQLANRRLSDRLMRRLGWERHMAASAKLHYIKRFDREAARSPAQERLAAELAKSLSEPEHATLDYSNSSG